MSATTATAKINLAPEIYQNHQRDKRRRKIATSLGIAVSVIAVAVVVIAGVVLAAQSVAISVLKHSIASDENKLKTYPDLINAATAQEHLTSWQQLEQQKLYLSRFFTVLQTAAPQGITISNLTIDPQNNLEVTGTSQTYTLASKFAQALAASNTIVGPNASPSQPPYFTKVQFESLSATEQGSVDFQLTTTMSTEVTTNGKQ